VVLLGEHGFRVVYVIGGIGPVHPIGKELRLSGFVGLKIDHHLARYRAALRGYRLRPPEAHYSGDIWRVMLPAAPGDGVTPAHQEAIAWVHRLVRGHLRRAVEVPQGRRTAPVKNVKQDAVVSPSWLHWPEDAKVRREGHLTAGIPRRQFQVSNRAVGGMAGINSEVGYAINLLIRAGLFKNLTMGKGLLRCYVKFGYCHFAPL
jgi:hypothetical protein